MANFVDITDQVSNFDGLLVVGDIHGNWSEFEVVLNRAKDENLFILSLGDVMDYGVENIKCFEMLNDLILDGQARMMIGNHELKLFKYINNARENGVRPNRQGGIATTLEELNGLTDTQLVEFEDKFLDAFANSSYIVKCNDYFFAHGAIDPKFWSNLEFQKATKSMSMFGQVDNKAPPSPDGYPIRRYEWVDDVPKDVTVIVGHDIRSKHAPYEQLGKNGGKVIFLDTGSSKGGQLSSMKLFD